MLLYSVRCAVFPAQNFAVIEMVDFLLKECSAEKRGILFVFVMLLSSTLLHTENLGNAMQL